MFGPRAILATIIFSVSVSACSHTTAESRDYAWRNVTPAASYPTGRIMRTRDGRTWETLAEQSNLPKRIFYSTIVFKNKIWLLGGYDGKDYFNDVWNSEDGVKWQRVVENVAWSPRQSATLVYFKNRVWLFGGGVIDGEKEINPSSQKEVWSSEDGTNWTQEKMTTERSGGGTPIVFDDKLWFVGANRNDGNFGNGKED